MASALHLKCLLVAKTKKVVCTRTRKSCCMLNDCIHTDTARQAIKDLPLLSPWSLLRHHLQTQKGLPQLLPSPLLAPSLHHLPAGTLSCWQCVPVLTCMVPEQPMSRLENCRLGAGETLLQLALPNLLHPTVQQGQCTSTS